MTNLEIIEDLKETLHVVNPKINLDGITEKTLLKEDLGLDSLYMILMALAIEKKFNIKFNPETTPKSVEDICRFIAEKVEQK